MRDHKVIQRHCKGKQETGENSRHNIWKYYFEKCIGRRRMGKGFILLYGHTHDSNEDTYYQSCLMKMVESDCQHVYKTEVKAINVGCMKPWMNYEPRTLTELLSYPQ